MYVRVVSKQAIEEVLLCCMPSVVSLGRWEIPRRAQCGSSWCSRQRRKQRRLSPSHASSLFRILAFGSFVPLRARCLDALGSSAVLRFAKKCAHALPADTPKPVEEFTSAHPLFWFGASTKKSTHIPTTRWRNSWKAVFLRSQPRFLRCNVRLPERYIETENRRRTEARVFKSPILPRWFSNQWFTDSLVAHANFYFL
jgi:hypothetical protein